MIIQVQNLLGHYDDQETQSHKMHVFSWYH